MERSHEITDSSDWFDTAVAPLGPVETALRCQICKGFFDTPMITSCCHTFCSLCIRRCLTGDGKCPVCRSPDQELRLRKNVIVGELVEAFQSARPSILKLGREAAAHAEVAKRSTSKRKINEVDQDDSATVESQQRTTRSRSRKSPRRWAGDGPSRPNSTPSSPRGLKEYDGEGHAEDDHLTPCPICGERMRVEDVFLHLDKHQDRPTKPSDPSRKIPSNTKAFAKTPERLPQLSYSILKETALRKKLSELGIPNWGPRPLLIRRHTEWINLWNANCDSSSPRRKRELLRDLDVWERTQGGHATTSTGTVGGGKSVMDKEFDGTAWAASHDDDFQQLIARARRKPPAPVAPESEPVGHAPDESFEDDSSKMKLDEASDGGTPNPNADVSLTMPFGDASVLKNFDEDLQSGSSTDCMIVLSR